MNGLPPRTEAEIPTSTDEGRAASAPQVCRLEVVSATPSSIGGPCSDRLIDFVDGIFDRLEREIDPSLLDCTIEPLIPIEPATAGRS